MTPNELAKEHKLLVVGQELLALNDDLVHEVLIVADDGAMQPGVMLKDLGGGLDDGIIVEYGFLDTLIRNLIQAKAHLTEVAHDMIENKMASEE